MLHAQNRKFKREFEHRTVIRILVIFSLIAASILVFAVAPGSASAGASRAERRNHRIRVPPRRLPAQSTAMQGSRCRLLPIDVDRTDDAAVASACTAAPNDCSLRGAVAFANLIPGTTINVPAGTYQLNIPGGAGKVFPAITRSGTSTSEATTRSSRARARLPR